MVKRMKLTRRNGIVALFGAIVGAMTGGVVNSQTTSSGSVSGSVVSFGRRPSRVLLSLADENDTQGWSEVSVTYRGETVSISAKEIFEALKSGK